MKKEFDKDLLNFPPKNDLNPLKISQYLLMIVVQPKKAGKSTPREWGLIYSRERVISNKRIFMNLWQMLLARRGLMDVAKRMSVEALAV